MFRLTLFSTLLALPFAPSLAAQSQTVQYAYDSLNRLVEVRYPDRIVDYTYDPAGNRLTLSVQGTTAISQVVPSSGGQGQTSLNVAVTGQFTHFVNGMTIADFGPGVTVHSTTVTDETHAVVNVTIAFAASLGARTVTLTTSSEMVQLASGFTVTAGTPVITLVTPNSG